MKIITTKTGNLRKLIITTDNGKARELHYGVMLNKTGNWELPDPNMIAREVKALITSELPKGETIDIDTRLSIENIGLSISDNE